MSKRTIKRIVKKIADKAVISKTVSPQHALRHTFAVNKKIKKIQPHLSTRCIYVKKNRKRRIF